MTLYDFTQKCKRTMYRFFCSPIIKHSLASCGRGVYIPSGCFFLGIQNVSIGNNVSLSEGTTILSTRAKVIIGNDVMFGPNVTIISGNHRVDLVGRTMISVKDEEKLEENDQDIIIEGDNWLSANCTILKGVTIGFGSVVAAGAVVTKSIPPYSIVGGVPAKVIRRRFSDDDLKLHLNKSCGKMT